MRRLLLSVVALFAACNLSDSPTAPPDFAAPVAPSFDFGGGSGLVLASTNEGELVEIDLNAGSVSLIGDAGEFGGDDVAWTDIAFDATGSLWGISRVFTEAEFEVHLYKIDPSDGSIISDEGSIGEHVFADFDHDGTAFYGSGRESVHDCCGRLFTIDETVPNATWISAAATGYGLNPFSLGPIASGGFAVHPVTGEFWGIEALQSIAPVVYRIDPTTGEADLVYRMAIGGVPVPRQVGFDALHILEDGTFIAKRGGGFTFPDSLLWTIGTTPDVNGLVEIAPFPLTVDPAIVGSLNGLAKIAEDFSDPGPVVVTIESTTTTGVSGSFVSEAPENQVSHTGSVTPSIFTPSLSWTVQVLTPRSALVVGPEGGTGTSFTWTVATQQAARYQGYTHADAIAALASSAPLPNALRFGVTLTATDESSQQHSDTEVVSQDEIDAIRQEYSDFRRRTVPARAAFGTPESVHFSAGELNFGDYSVYITTPALLTGLESVRAELSSQLGVDTPLTLTGAYRNPVHHTLHVRATSIDSQHEIGTAADIRIHDHDMDRDEFFEYLRISAQQVNNGACWEPAGDIIAASEGGMTLTHAHIDWRTGCPDDWRLP